MHLSGGASKVRKIKGVTPGGTIGDINVLGVLENRCVTVTAAVKSTVLVLSRSSFEAAITTPKDYAFIQSAAHLQETTVAFDRETFCDLEGFKKLGFDQDYVAALFGQVEHRLLYPGSFVMREGGHGNEMYIISAGQVRMEKDRKPLSSLGDGAMFGELAVLGTDKRRRVTAQCQTPTLIAVLNGDVMNELLDDFPNARKAFHHAYIKSLVGEGLANASDEIRQLNAFYGKVHPLKVSEMVDKGLATEQSLRRPRSAYSGSRPSTARKWTPMKVPSRPSTAMDMSRAGSPLVPSRPGTARDMYRAGSPELLLPRRCQSSCA